MSKQGKRDTYKYRAMKNRRTVHVGITNDLGRREHEHNRDIGPGVRLVQEGRRTTREAALKWERQQTKKGRPTRK